MTKARLNSTSVAGDQLADRPISMPLRIRNASEKRASVNRKPTPAGGGSAAAKLAEAGEEGRGLAAILVAARLAQGNPGQDHR